MGNMGGCGGNCGGCSGSSGGNCGSGGGWKCCLTGVLSQDFWPFGLVALGLKDCGDIQCKN